MDPNAFLMGAAVPSMRWDQPGARLSGRVVHRETRLQTVFGTNEVKKWPSGDPMYQLVVHVQTALRDPMIENDNGVRAMYVKGKLFTDAVRDAVRAAGAPGVEVGGMIDVVYTGNDMTSKAPIPPKIYQVRYQAAPPQVQPQGFPAQQYPQPSQYDQAPQYGQQPQYAHNSSFQQPPAPYRAPGPSVYLQHDPYQPSHHEQGPPPEWAAPAAMPAPEPWPAPAPTEPAPPTMSTLAHIKAHRDAPASGQPYGDMEPAF